MRRIKFNKFVLQISLRIPFDAAALSGMFPSHDNCFSLLMFRYHLHSRPRQNSQVEASYTSAC